jgi:predicted MPP superfamily phosphohydrolase
MELTADSQLAPPSAYFLNKRRAIELGQITSWGRKGQTRIHPESEWLFRAAIRSFLDFTGLYERGRRNALSPVISSTELAFPNLPPSFDGFCILHLSDIHGDGIEGFAAQVAPRLRGLEADLCVMTGDYRFEVDGPCDGVYLVMEAIVDAVSARHGVAGILGNHDSIEMVRPLEKLGVRMLLNQNWEIRRGDDSLWLLGVDDPHYYGCDDLIGACSAVPDDAFRILLAHSPEIVEEAEAYGVHLYFCGHTHGGQICLPGLGPLFLNATCRRKFTRGHWRFAEMQGYTNRGLGSSGVPVRYNCPPEIALITLRRGERTA